MLLLFISLQLGRLCSDKKWTGILKGMSSNSIWAVVNRRQKAVFDQMRCVVSTDRLNHNSTPIGIIIIITIIIIIMIIIMMMIIIIIIMMMIIIIIMIMITIKKIIIIISIIII